MVPGYRVIRFALRLRRVLSPTVPVSSSAGVVFPAPAHTRHGQRRPCLLSDRASLPLGATEICRCYHGPAFSSAGSAPLGTAGLWFNSLATSRRDQLDDPVASTPGCVERP